MAADKNGNVKHEQTLTVEQWPVGRVREYANNPRKNDGAVAKVAASLREFGFRQPLVVDAKGTLVVGHTRLKAARSLGLATVPVHVAKGLTAAQLKAYRLADNRTAQEAEWDDDLLALELNGLELDGLDLTVTGFDVSEIAKALGRAPDFEPATAEDQGRLDQKAPIVCPKCQHEFRP